MNERIKKRPLTLIEIVISIVLAGFLLMGLFNVLRQALQKNITVKKLKQKVFQLELFQLRIKNLMLNLVDYSRITIEQYPGTAGPALYFSYKNSTDPEADMCGNLRCMLFLNSKKELCLASWSEGNKCRIDVLLDEVSSFKCRLYDTRKKEWSDNRNMRRRETPPMIAIDLHWAEKEIPFIFFPSGASETVIYPS